jgi:hypothetical protein
MFRYKRDDLTGGWRKLHNHQLRNFNYSPNSIRMIKSGKMCWAGHVIPMWEERNAYRILVGKPKRLFGRPVSR